jgi:hypothetical protein
VLGMEVLGYNALYFNQLALFGMELEEYWIIDDVGCGTCFADWYFYGM